MVAARPWTTGSGCFAVTGCRSGYSFGPEPGVNVPALPRDLPCRPGAGSLGRTGEVSGYSGAGMGDGTASAAIAAARPWTTGSGWRARTGRVSDVTGGPRPEAVPGRAWAWPAR